MRAMFNVKYGPGAQPILSLVVCNVTQSSLYPNRSIFCLSQG